LIDTTYCDERGARRLGDGVSSLGQNVFHEQLAAGGRTDRTQPQSRRADVVGPRCIVRSRGAGNLHVEIKECAASSCQYWRSLGAWCSGHDINVAVRGVPIEGGRKVAGIGVAGIAYLRAYHKYVRSCGDIVAVEAKNTPGGGTNSQNSCPGHEE
jgi:hypothetical protein